jgi:small acid-soluble spore protein I (minor)
MLNMSSFNLRGAIMQNISGSSQDDVEATIVDALQSGEEKMLPGLGVLMEIYWNQANEAEKQEMTQRISRGLQ